MLQGYTMAIVPCGNPTPKKLPTGGGEWPTFRTARAQRAHSTRYAPSNTRNTVYTILVLACIRAHATARLTKGECRASRGGPLSAHGP